ncbi:ribonuclease III domain-containing protein [Stachybotrys elegans]|uniref:Large ribosomal subunit protein mL44 n=1 Tax=Stachybotrys elegans TaxID=80388 RepID=A0A8K0T0R0_9HYPO|nr:ribonuclease III domain-containing protein [Stachybotrys elegans]
MKRVRLSRCSGPLLAARPRAAAPSRPAALSVPVHRRTFAALAQESHQDDIKPPSPPSPRPSKAASSAKLAALHARLSLSNKIPLETLARALVTISADSHANFNNTSLARLGRSIVSFHVIEYLMCKYPRLPTPIFYEAIRAYAGPETLHLVARQWGVESAAAPGHEVDPGLLQWSVDRALLKQSLQTGYIRSEDVRKFHVRRGMSSRVVYDDEFGDKVADSSADPAQDEALSQAASYSSFVEAVVGAIYAHCGRDAAKSFVTSHILSRQVDLSAMFEFKDPTRELTMLCAREGFEPPVAHLESESGRLSRTPVFIVGIYSGTSKLGEAAGPSLNLARQKASMAALKAWYLYSPGNKVRVPSDMMEEGAEPWKAPHIDPGEIV